MEETIKKVNFNPKQKDKPIKNNLILANARVINIKMVFYS